MGNHQISFMEKSDIQESAHLLSVAMLDNPLHIAVFTGKGEKERLEIEGMFCELLIELPGIVFLAKAYLETDLDKNVGFYEKFGFKIVSETKIFDVKNRYMLRASRA